MSETKQMQQTKQNPLGTQQIKKLLLKFAVPSIIAMLVSSLYNIVDQIFIGQSVGTLGNAATNVAFPLSTTCTAISLLLGIGGASSFNLAMGEGKGEESANYIGNAATLLFLSGTVLCIITHIFLTPMLKIFGAPADVLGYAEQYTGITSFGFPFLIFSIGGGHLIRADGSPRYTMMCNLTGAIINTILDPILIFGFGLGMTGAAVATVTGQVIAAGMAFYYFCHYKTVPLRLRHLRLQWKYIGRTISLGASPFFNQLAMTVVQVVMNKSLTHYGALSVYGEAIPLACSGIVNKVNMLFFSVIIGISQGLQPIASFNYGAEKYGRVREAYMKAATAGACVCTCSFLIFQIFPHPIISLFGSGSELYYQFATRYLRIFLFFTFANFLQPITSNFFTAIGKPKKGVFLSLTRQIIFLLPMILILPYLFGIDGIVFAGPIADGAAALAAIMMVRRELREIKQLEKKQAITSL